MTGTEASRSRLTVIRRLVRDAARVRRPVRLAMCSATAARGGVSLDPLGLSERVRVRSVLLAGAERGPPREGWQDGLRIIPIRTGARGSQASTQCTG